jgi:hypothetical protein
MTIGYVTALRGSVADPSTGVINFADHKFAGLIGKRFFNQNFLVWGVYFQTPHVHLPKVLLFVCLFNGKTHFATLYSVNFAEIEKLFSRLTTAVVDVSLTFPLRHDR